MFGRVVWCRWWSTDVVCLYFSICFCSGRDLVWVPFTTLKVPHCTDFFMIPLHFRNASKPDLTKCRKCLILKSCWKNITQYCMLPLPALAHQRLDFRRCCVTDFSLGFRKHLSTWPISVGLKSLLLLFGSHGIVIQHIKARTLCYYLGVVIAGQLDIRCSEEDTIFIWKR